MMIEKTHNSTKRFIALMIIFVMILMISVAYGATLSASKTMSSGNYQNSVLKVTATASCPTTGTFSWTTSTKENYRQGLAYSIYTTKSVWTKNNSNNELIYKWSYQVNKLPTIASGVPTKYKTGSDKATFTYNSTKKSLTVK